MMQVITGCTGDCCPKAKDCERYYENLSKKQKCSFPLESWATFGSGSMWMNSETGESGCSIDSYCGPNGEYKMFKRFELPLSELTLGEIKKICSDHQKQNCDCETCKIVKFCNSSLTSYSFPSGWKLNGENND